MSREKLQSIKEQPTSVNDELKSHVDQLACSNSDLQDLIAATDIATVFLPGARRRRRKLDGAPAARAAAQAEHLSTGPCCTPRGWTAYTPRGANPQHEVRKGHLAGLNAPSFPLGFEPTPETGACGKSGLMPQSGRP
jgi:hypothetical protein